ncbi:phospholipid-transporting ATPase ID isoform X2 [Ctenocephalides felis]|uniref:phospholipid-transporting ATPase ID isoform X2 n=1 Tax=Ctenocephalides felis TaxID=7515 RepID=UPI000E6E4841|nr:phospholipid-transporting ATPase ID isoform X2 [Ctenocephalides felis]
MRSADAVELELFDMHRDHNDEDDDDDDDEEEDDGRDKREDGALHRCSDSRHRHRQQSRSGKRFRGKSSVGRDCCCERSRSVRAKRSPYLQAAERRERSLPDVRSTNINISVNLGCRGSDDAAGCVDSSESLPQRNPRKHHGLRNSLLTVIGKLVVWSDNRRYYRRDQGSVTGPGPSESASSQYFKSFIVTETERRIRANDREYNSQFKYANNIIKTSKYSIFTFLPLNLLEQFQRLANFYFLVLLVLQLVPAISSLTPVTTAMPLFGVLALTAVKDAYDDFQRHMSDSQVNKRRSKTLRNGKLVEERWSGVQVGDVIRMDNDQFVAADILLLTTSEPNGLCFIETAELDGETNLKCRQCIPETAEMGQRNDLLGQFNGEIVCETPNNLLNKFEGALTWKGKRYSLDNEKILLRGCVLRNTQWCYGVVIFAGKDTKLMQNSGKTKLKRTSIDKLLNFLIIGIVYFLISMCIFCMVGCGIWEGLVGRDFQVYLPWDSIVPREPLTGSTVIAFLVFFSYAIVLNTVVPISLYVSVEVIRFVQSFLINWDEKMYYEKTKTSAKARTTTLNEELGQIQYIFSDKTGTLTQNIMTFNKCSIAGISYGDAIDLKTGEIMELSEKAKYQNLNETTSSVEEYQPKSNNHHHDHANVVVINPRARTVSGSDSVFNAQTSYVDESQTTSCYPKNGRSHSSHTALLFTEHPVGRSTPEPRLPRARSPSHPTTDPIDFSFNSEYEPEFKFYDQTLLESVNNNNVHTHNFFRLLALCHTVMPAEKNGRLEYQAQSPDESALVSAARNFGFVFRERSPNTITIEVMGKVEEYELLCILDFNNVRKRMSVVVKRDGHLMLLCKGADNVIYERLAKGQIEIKTKTQEHLNKFAGEGLRTLCLASREIDEQFFLNWKIRQQEAALSMDSRDDKLDAIYEEIETDLVLLGVTAIEDKLQDGVPETIANLGLAGIKIWVLTGDKQETAINIGYSCQLLTDDLIDLFIVDGETHQEVEKQLDKFKESIRIVNTYHPHAQANGANNGMSSMALPHKEPTRARTESLSTPTEVGRPPPAISVVTFSTDTDYEGATAGGATSAHNNSSEESSEFAIVINGHSLVHCLDPSLEKRFIEIASQCKSVICCRVTPLQKALVVELIKRTKNAVTLAIGDGANDVSMIKAAHIGVGISGQEGMQAVLASDYSIAQFRFLERLLLVHGRWSYYRMCKFLRYFFYKNFAFTLCHIWFAFFCGFSAQTVFDEMYISVYNLFYTSLPVLALGIFDQDVSDKNAIIFPKLYTPGLTSALFNKSEFMKSALQGCFSSLLLFLIPYGTYKDGVSPSGLILSDHMLLGSVVASILVIENTAQIALDTSYWTVFNHITTWGSLLSYFILDFFYNYVIGGPYVGSLTQAMQESQFWFTTLLTVISTTVPVLAWRFYFVDVFPNLTEKIRMKQRLAQIKSRHSTDVLRTPSARKVRRSIRSGYAFAHQEGFGRLITSGKIMKKLPSDFGFPTLSGRKGNTNSPKEPRAPCQDLDTINL